MDHGRFALAQATLGVVVVLLLLGGSLWVLRPFIGPGIWATMIVVTTWPLMRRLQAALWGRRWLATLVMTLALLMLLVVPLLLAIGTIVGHAQEIIAWAKTFSGTRLSLPPAWLARVPLVGGQLVQLWYQVVASGFDGLVETLSPYAGELTRWFVGEVGNLGFLLVQFLLTLLLAAVMYAGGERWAEVARQVGLRLAGRRGERVIQLAAESLRGVALGVGVTAVVQSVLGGLALALAGVPFAGLLTAVMLMLCLAQLGPMPVLLAAAGWLFWKDSSGWAVFMLVATGVIGTLDNVIRPWLIRLGADLPLLLILAGVIGGLLAFGLVGIFIGPVILAVGWTLLLAWIGDDEALAERGLDPALEAADAVEPPA
jgi:predicted PurR-regulated permease PerM